MDQQDASGKAGRSEDLLLEHGDDIVEFLFGHAFLVVAEVAFFVEFDHGVVAATGHRCQAEVALEGVAAPAQDVIPDRFDAACRNREGNPPLHPLHAVAARGQLGC